MEKTAVLVRKSAAGRKKSLAPVVKKSISMTTQTYEYLTSIGKGKLSLGVKLAAEAHEQQSWQERGEENPK